MVKCAIGHEREVAFCLMQKCMDVQSQGIKQQIKSVITLDYLTNYIYIEADKEAHVKEACKGMRHIYSNTKPMLVPIKEMTDVLSVKSKSVELSKDTWVRVKLGTYKGDLAKVLDVDNMRQRVTIKLIPRIDLKALANKLEGNEVGKKKKNFVPPPRFINTREMKYMHIPVERRQDSITGEYFETIDGMMFKDGYLYKIVSMKSISSQNIQPSFDELEKFRKPGKDSDGDMASLSTAFAYRTEGHFMKGDAVIVVRGDLKNLMGWVEKVEEESVYIRSNIPSFKETLAVNEKELCKYFKPGDHVKVVSGAQEGATGMLVKGEGHVLIISSDTTKEDIRVFADNVVEISSITFGITKIGDYLLHSLVQMDNSSCGVIISVESDAFQVLKGVPERAAVVWVKSREIRKKIKRKRSTQDRYGST
ncbi:putative transcription elongation factor SPT5 homolog 1, partial [Amborella trichopoda]